MTKHERFAKDDGADVKVRVGTPDDIDGMMSISLLATEENGFVVPDPMKLLENLWAALNLDHGIVGIVGNPGNEIEGAVLLRIGTPWYGARDVIEEKAIFIHPSFRSARGGRFGKLAEFSKQVSDTLDLPLAIGVLSNERTTAKVRRYRAIFGEPSGAYWLYNARTGDVFSPL